MLGLLSATDNRYVAIPGTCTVDTHMHADNRYVAIPGNCIVDIHMHTDNRYVAILNICTNTCTDTEQLVCRYT